MIALSGDQPPGGNFSPYAQVLTRETRCEPPRSSPPPSVPIPHHSGRDASMRRFRPMPKHTPIHPHPFWHPMTPERCRTWVFGAIRFPGKPPRLLQSRRKPPRPTSPCPGAHQSYPASRCRPPRKIGSAVWAPSPETRRFCGLCTAAATTFCVELTRSACGAVDVGVDGVTSS